MRTLHCNVLRPDGSKLPVKIPIHTELVIDTDPTGPRYGLVMEADGRARLVVADSAPMGHGGTMRVQAQGGLEATVRIVTPIEENEEMGARGGDSVIALQRSALPSPFPAESGLLRIDRAQFVTEDGRPWPLRGCSDFRVFERWMKNRDLCMRVLDERQSMGFNCLRVFGLNAFNGWPNTFDFGPMFVGGLPAYVDGLSSFCSELATRGLRMQFTVFGGGAKVHMNNADAQLTFWKACVTALEANHWNAQLVELVNENLDIDASKFSKPQSSRLLFSHGSTGGGAYPVEPVWDYADLHPDRAVDWVRKAVHNPMEDIVEHFRIPGTAGEPIGAGEAAIPGRRDNDPACFRQMGAGSLLLHSGAYFHSDNGIQSEPFSPTQRACAEAFIAGCAAMDMTYRAGQYTRSGLSDLPVAYDAQTVTRIYARLLGNRAAVVACQPTANFRWVVNQPWRLVKQPCPEVIFVER
jgi:hypothetical protein